MTHWTKTIALSAAATLLLTATRRVGTDRGRTGEADAEPCCESDQRPVPGELGFRPRRSRRHRHAAQHSARDAVRRQQQHEPDPAGHHADDIAAGPTDARINGLGDIVATAFFSPQKRQHHLGRGPVFLLPAATNASLGAEKFGIGPSVVALAQPGPWTVGFALQSYLVGQRRERSRRRQLDVPAAVRQLQPWKRTLCWRELGGERELGGGRHVDRTGPLQRQQSDAARETACQLRVRRRSDDRQQ